MAEGSGTTVYYERKPGTDEVPIDALQGGQVRELFRCRYCGLTHPEHPLTPEHDGFGAWEVVCPGCRVEAPHDILTRVSATLRRMDARCEECDYTTMLWSLDDDGKLPPCPECHSPTKVAQLRKLPGVTRSKAQTLIAAGLDTIEELQYATQEMIADVDGIGVALAARIMASVGEPGDGSLTKPVDDREFFEGHEGAPRLVVADATWSFAGPSDDADT